MQSNQLFKPLNNSSMTSLEIHSSPVQLATRSLSSRSLARSGANSRLVESAQSSVRSSPSRRKVKTSSKLSNKNEVVEERHKLLTGSVEGGFNIADHLRSSVDNRRLSGGSLSPDMQKLLQDIDSVMQSIGPTMESSQALQEPSTNGSTSAKSRQKKYTLVSAHQGPMHDKKAKRPPKLAANFDVRDGADVDQSKRKKSTKLSPQSSGISNTAPTEDHTVHDVGCEVRLPPAARDTSNNLPDQPDIPRLNLGSSTDNQQTVAAAIKIQNWYRKENDSSTYVQPPVEENENNSRLITGKGDTQTSSQVEQVKFLLKEKKTDFDRSRQEEMERMRGKVEAQERRAAEREQRRAAKLMADRKAAIEELQRRREEKRARIELLAREEMVSI